jgi:hypothetical protein
MEPTDCDTRRAYLATRLSHAAEAASSKKVATNGRGFRYIFDLIQLLINRIMKKSQVVAMPESETPPVLDQQDK